MYLNLTPEKNDGATVYRLGGYDRSVQFFADEDDVPLLLSRLNEDPELAFIVCDDPVLLYTRSSSDLVAERRQDIHPTSALVIRTGFAVDVLKRAELFG